MQNTDKVHNLIILDESGSMRSIKDYILSGFNEVVQTVKGVAMKFPEQAHYISFFSFNGVGIKQHLLGQALNAIDELDGTKYRPAASTPLYDAIGHSIATLQAYLNYDKECHVLVTILTDGLENASKEYNRAAIKKLIEELEDGNWTFTYIGANHAVEQAANSISIKNTLTFEANASSIKQTFAAESAAREKYSSNVRKKKSSKSSFYSKE